jgi:hypothetical protein
VRLSAVKDWNDLQAANQELKDAEAALVSTKAALPRFGSQPLVTEDKFPEFFKPFRDRIAAAKARISAISAKGDSTLERYMLWIELPVRERCRARDEMLCRDNSELEQIRTKMQQQ